MSPGVQRCQLLRRAVFLVDGRAVLVDRESVPLHMAGEEAPVIEQALARVLVEELGLWETYGPLLGALHPNIFQEAQRMARSKGKGGGLDLRPFIKQVGLDKFIEVLDLDELVETVGPKKLIKAVGLKRFIADLSNEDLTDEDRRRLKELLGE
jgi:hypothetical protein